MRRLWASGGADRTPPARRGGTGTLAPLDRGAGAAALVAAPSPSHPGTYRGRPVAIAISLCAVLAFAGFGALLGAAASPRGAALAASRAPLRVILPSTASAPSPTVPPPTAPQAESEAPSEGEVPTVTPPTPAQETAPATRSAPKTGSGSGSGASETESGSAPASGTPATKLPAIKHVFLVMLSDEPYATAFGPVSPARYLSHTLERQGTLLVRYDAVAHEQLANEIAVLSGQGPTAATAANCPTYTDLATTGRGADGQVLGEGCVYPASTPTLVGQLAATHRRARAYIDGIGEPGAAPAGCARPALGQVDATSAQLPAGGPYATFRNPFLYFHSVTDSPACAGEDVPLARLRTDLLSAPRTPSLSLISPDRCHDGNPTPCTAGAPAGMAAADAFLSRVVPEILASPAYLHGGLLVITVDEAPSSGEFADSSACCGQPVYPNLPAAATPAGLGPRGGGTVGALLLSPSIRGGTTSQEPYDHFSLLRTIEDLFKLPHLGYAALPAVKPIDPSLFTAPGAH